MASRIEDYAVLGDLGTAALIGLDGSVDWLCLPRFDSPACFAAMLGTSDHGRWMLAPTDEYEVSRRYVGDSFVLETTYTTQDGQVRVLDAMPLGDGRADLVRQVTGLRGSVQMCHEWVVRFGYGKVRPWVHRIVDDQGNPALHAVAGPDMLVLRGTRLPTAVDHRHADTFDVGAGETLHWSTTWFPAWSDVPAPLDVATRLADTERDWSQWVARRPELVDTPYEDALVRSLLVLRMLTHAETGGIVAAPTTSLPEQFAGPRNWDYRFCWLRDAALTLQALIGSGFRTEARAWRTWLLRAVAGDPEDLQIMYGVDGGRELPERVLAHLPGYEGSLPVRVGNAAVDQHQTDVLGEVMVALESARDAGLHEDDMSWSLQRTLVTNLEKHWRDPDNGIWEIRGEPQHFTHSRVMVWAAFDRAVRAVEEHGLPGPVVRWRALRDLVRAEVLDQGFDAELGSFVQFYGAKHTDASLLHIPLVGFLPPDDPRVVGTIRAMESELMHDGLLLRYRTERGIDGLPPGEHPFLACTFWYAEVLAAQGQAEACAAVLDRLVALGGSLGLLAEEYDPVEQRMAGNYPQALSHLSLVRAVTAYRDLVKPAEQDREEAPMNTYTGEVTPGGRSDVRELEHLTIRKASVSEQDNNTYLLTCRATGAQLLVDAADDAPRVLQLLDEGTGRLDVVVTTHQHRDHHRALDTVVTRTGARTAAGAEDADALPVAPDDRLVHGDQVRFGDVVLDVLHLRGHTPGSVVLVYRDPSGHPHAFTGDSLFPGGVGSTFGDDAAFTSLVEDVEQRVFGALPDDTWVYPGHGKDTTLGVERPHLQEWRDRGW